MKSFVALGAGFMLATAIVEIVPTSFELRGRSASFLFLLVYFIITFFEHTVTPHFHFGEETHHDQFVRGHHGYSVLLGLVIHTFFDGIAIASGFIVSNWLGWVIFLAVFLHKIPEGFTIASVMLASGRSRRLAWGASVLLGAATFAGVLTMALLRRHVDVGLPLSGGVTIYVAASDLMPEVNRDRKSTRLNSSHANIYTLSLHDALPISRDSPLLPSCLPADEAGDSLGGLPFCSEPLLLPEF